MKELIKSGAGKGQQCTREAEPRTPQLRADCSLGLADSGEEGAFCRGQDVGGPTLFPTEAGPS